MTPSDWLGLCAWLVDESVIVGTLTVKCLTSALWAALHVAAEDVQLALRDAAIMAGLAIRSPIVLLLPISNALKHFAADPEGGGNSILCHSARIDLTSSFRGRRPASEAQLVNGPLEALAR